MSLKSSENLSISIMDILSIISQYRKFILSSTFLALIVSVLISFNVTKLYKAEVLLVPSTQESSSILDNYGAIGGLAGINIPGSDYQAKQEAISVLSSKIFINDFVRKNDLTKIFFPEKWDGDKNEWKEDIPNFIGSIKNIFASNSGGVGRDGLLPGEPSKWDVYEFFDDVLEINENRLNGTISISVELSDPEEASKIANDLVLSINDRLQRENNIYHQRSIGYLRQQLQDVQINNLRNVIIKIIGEHLSQLAISNAKDDYVFKVIDPAIVPEDRSYPNRIMMLLVGGFLGFLGSLIGAVFLSMRKYES